MLTDFQKQLLVEAFVRRKTGIPVVAYRAMPCLMLNSMTFSEDQCRLDNPEVKGLIGQYLTWNKNGDILTLTKFGEKVASEIQEKESQS